MNTRTQYRPDLRTTLDLPTAIHTNSTLIAGMPDDFDGNLRQRRQAEAKAHAAGVSTTGKRFVGQLCPKEEPFSPKAWVSESDYLGGCKALAIQQGKSLTAGSGRTVVEAPVDDTPDPSDKPYRVSEHVVKRAVKQEIRAMTARGEPAPNPAQRAALAEKLCEHHSGN